MSPRPGRRRRALLHSMRKPRPEIVAKVAGELAIDPEVFSRIWTLMVDAMLDRAMIDDGKTPE